MVKGISRQVIVVQSPGPELFEQAIFILKEDAPEVTDEALLKEARKVLHMPLGKGKRKRGNLYGPLWACGGAVATGFLWLLTALF